MEALFVQTAASMTSDRGTITLRGLSPSTLTSPTVPSARSDTCCLVTHLDGDALTYSIKLLDGTVPTATGPRALFIDPFGRPLSPVSAAGMHRRERRRRWLRPRLRMSGGSRPSVALPALTAAPALLAPRLQSRGARLLGDSVG